MKNAFASDEFRQHWPTVVAALLGTGCGLLTLPLFSIGLIAPELHRQFGWSLSQIMTGLTVQMVCVMLLSPLVGLAVDRLSVRVVGMTSLFLLSLTFASLALTRNNLTLFYTQWAVMTISGVGTMPNTWMRAINSCFDQHKGLALCLCLLGSGVCSVVIKPYLAWAIALHGWRFAYVAVAALPLLIALPACWFGLPRKAVAQRNLPSERPADLPGYLLREALRDCRFWALAASSSAISFAISGIIPHQEGILTAHGFSHTRVVETVTLFGVGLIVGRLGGGFLIDVFWAPGVAFALLSLSSAGVFLLSLPGIGLGAASVGTLAVGFASGLEWDVVPYLLSRHFGPAHFAAINGTITSLYYWTVGIGPWVYALSFDHFGDYTLVLRLSVLLLIVGALPMLILGRYRFPASSH